MCDYYFQDKNFKALHYISNILIYQQNSCYKNCNLDMNKLAFKSHMYQENNILEE